MPEVHFTIRWPDGDGGALLFPLHRDRDLLRRRAQTYPLTIPRQRAAQALERASDRVEAKYGFACTIRHGPARPYRGARPDHFTDPDRREVTCLSHRTEGADD